MKKIKVLLADPRHETVGTHSYFVPIGIGYIGSNLLKEFKNNNLELKLSVEPEEIFSLLEDWRPDIIGISNYVWNTQLSYTICKYAKKMNPDSLCILGGPEFPAGQRVPRQDELRRGARRQPRRLRRRWPRPLRPSPPSDRGTGRRGPILSVASALTFRYAVTCHRHWSLAHEHRGAR